MRPPALSAAAVRDAIDRLIERPTTVVLTSHARQKMRERHFTLEDVLWVLRRGSVLPNPEWDPNGATWRYRVRSRCRDNELLTLVVALSDVIVVITGHE